MDRHTHWHQVWSTKTEGETSWFQDRPEHSLQMIAASGGQAVVDVGGGASRLADCLLDLGADVTVVDIAEPALAQARSRLGERAGGVAWVAADVTTWVPPRRYDIWHDRAVFHFLTDEADRAAYARVMVAALRPGGHAVIATFALDGPERCSALPVCRYDADGLAAQFAPAFRQLEAKAVDHVTPGGKVQRFLFSRFIRDNSIKLPQ
jgi:SAM-dependent methyltransferase